MDPFSQHFGPDDDARIQNDMVMAMAYPGVIVRVLAAQVPPRHPCFTGVVDLSRDLVAAVMDGSTGRKAIALVPEHLRIYFPERWMSPAEISTFMATLWDHPVRTRAGTTRIDILTGSPVILSDVSASAVKVLTAADPGTWICPDSLAHARAVLAS